MKQEEKISPNYRANGNYRADIYQFAPHIKKLSAIIDADAEQARRRMHQSIRPDIPQSGVIEA